MNIRCLDGGEILVAESSIGHIKRYTSKGEFLGIVGTAKIAGGCKHVAIAKDPARDWYFMMNTASNNIAVLVPRSEAPTETDDEREARLAMEGLGQKLIGSWRADVPKKDKAKEDDAASDATQEFDYAEYLLKQNRFITFEANGKVSRKENAPVTVTTKTVQKSSGFWGAVASLFGATTSTTNSVVNAAIEQDEPTRWIAIKQEGDAIQFAMEESEVRNYTAAVRFIDDKRAEFKWYYDEVGGEPFATISYVRVAGGPVGCSTGKECATTECAKPAEDKNASKVVVPEGQ